jgi:hypothetical protein
MASDAGGAAGGSSREIMLESHEARTGHKRHYRTLRAGAFSRRLSSPTLADLVAAVRRFRDDRD